jgi:hypothetical protein
MDWGAFNTGALVATVFWVVVFLGSVVAVTKRRK